MPPAHRAFLEGLRLSARFGDYFFCHAGIRPGVALEAQTAEDLMWIREDFLDDRRDHGVVVVHGHTVTDTRMPEVQPNRIDIDTGAVFGRAADVPDAGGDGGSVFVGMNRQTIKAERERRDKHE